MGNVRSVENWLSRCGVYSVATNIKTVGVDDLIIIPGVADAGKLLTEIEKAGIRGDIEKHIANNGRVLGICAGMQILYDYLDEGMRPGIGYFEGRVVRINPHNGWEEVAFENLGPIKKLNNCRKKVISGRMYFNHEYAACGVRKDVNGNIFTNISCRNSVVGIQAHPEKSQNMGINFFDLLVKK
jgi:glutamine amidotransferase